MSIPGRASAVIDHMVACVRASRDVVFVVLGVVVMLNKLPSLDDAGFSTPAARLWASLILFGALAALLGSFRDRVLIETWGCLAVVAGLLIWSLGLVLRPGPLSAASLAVALVILAAAHGEVVRILDSIGERRATR